MPELPEVETTTRGLRKTVTGLVIKDVWTDLATKNKHKSETVGNVVYFKTFKKLIVGKKVLSVDRRAKNILINISGNHTILIHMKMTGHLLYGKYKLTSSLAPLPVRPAGGLNKERGLRGGSVWVPVEKEGPLNDPFNKFLHVVFIFSNGKQLAFSDMRKFGKITLLSTKEANDTKHLAGLGPEPLLKSFDLQMLKERLSKKPNGKIKTTLMDQSVIAGIGNIYSDEILWRAGVHPERRVSQITASELKLMFKAIKETLSKGINFGGDSMSDYRNINGLPGKFQSHHEAYRRTGQKCRKPKCPGIILRKVIAGRSAHFCSAHQK